MMTAQKTINIFQNFKLYVVFYEMKSLINDFKASCDVNLANYKTFVQMLCPFAESTNLFTKTYTNIY